MKSTEFGAFLLAYFGDVQAIKSVKNGGHLPTQMADMAV